WLEQMMLPAAVLSAAMAIMHPNLYASGHEAVVHLYQDLAMAHPDEPMLVEMAEMLRLWPSVFTAMLVMVNCSTLFHRDHNSRVQWYDLLASIGSYHHAWFEVPTLGTACHYPPGSVVVVSGLLVRHGVTQTEGNRLCFASYMRDNVHQAVGVQRSDWVCYHALPGLWAGKG
ncbi:hypothetical protein BDN67DRAFT_914019, partial [Paxillus ammoniavirescens]